MESHHTAPPDIVTFASGGRGHRTFRTCCLVALSQAARAYTRRITFYSFGYEGGIHYGTFKGDRWTQSPASHLSGVNHLHHPWQV